jgi:hypothetical protein
MIMIMMIMMMMMMMMGPKMVRWMCLSSSCGSTNLNLCLMSCNSCFRMTIEDESSGFVFPAPRPNIAVNEWGLAKTMCRCNGTPAWSRRTPPKCRICQRKRAERRAKKEEERQKMIEATEETSEISEGNSSSVVKVTAAVDDRAGRSNENRNSDQMQVDEKGSGDVWATEKIVEEVVHEDSELPYLNSLISTELEARKENGYLRDEKGLVESVSEAHALRDAKEKAFTYSDNNLAMEIEERGDRESNKEVKQKPPLGTDISVAREIKEDGDKNQMKVVANTSLKASKLKNEKVPVDDNSNETKQLEGSGDKKTSSDANKLSSAHQKVSQCTDNEELQTKVKVANKYKINVNASWEVSTEVCILSHTMNCCMNILCHMSSCSGTPQICMRIFASLCLGLKMKFEINRSSQFPV